MSGDDRPSTTDTTYFITKVDPRTNSEDISNNNNKRSITPTNEKSVPTNSAGNNSKHNEISFEAKLAEIDWFSQPSNIKSGVVLRNLDENQRLFIIHEHGEIPLKVKFLTPLDNILERRSANEYYINDIPVCLLVETQSPKPNSPVNPSKLEKIPQIEDDELSRADVIKMFAKDSMSIMGPTGFPVNSTYNPKSSLLGEKVLLRVSNVVFLERTIEIGLVLFTNFRLLFVHNSKDSVLERELLPLGFVLSWEKRISNLSESINTTDLIIQRRDWRRPVQLRFNTKTECKDFITNMEKFAFPSEIKSIFAFDFKPEFDIVTPSSSTKKKARTWLPFLPDVYCNGDERFPLFSEYNIDHDWSDLYSVQKDFERMRINYSHWQISLNANFELCPTYPKHVVIPAKVTMELLNEAKQYRTKGRFPVVIWIHPKLQSTISRSSQPKPGPWSRQNQSDVAFLEFIHQNNPNKENLHVIDCRPKPNAEANRALQGGYEFEKYYNFITLEFQNIGNIHVMQTSFQMLRKTCEQSAGKNDEQWHFQIEESKWLQHIQLLLNSSARIAKLVNTGISVHVHCSDGWDRTPQVTAVAQVMLDPYYRTLTGFCVLIQKEFISLGHQFSSRVGIGNRVLTDRSPIFEQFIDCIFQLLVQYPQSFEFTDRLLVAILEGMYSNKFGTFVGNSDKERDNLQTWKTPSLFTFLHQRKNLFKFLNPVYCPPSAENKSPIVLDRQHYSLKSLHIWQDFYLRSSPHRDLHFMNNQSALVNLVEHLTKLQAQILLNSTEQRDLQNQIHFWKTTGESFSEYVASENSRKSTSETDDIFEKMKKRSESEEVSSEKSSAEIFPSLSREPSQSEIQHIRDKQSDFAENITSRRSLDIPESSRNEPLKKRTSSWPAESYDRIKKRSDETDDVDDVPTITTPMTNAGMYVIQGVATLIKHISDRLQNSTKSTTTNCESTQDPLAQSSTIFPTTVSPDGISVPETLTNFVRDDYQRINT